MVRYRRYYTQKNPDGSRTVVSAGPLAVGYFVLMKWLLVAAFWAFVVAWPLAFGWPFWAHVIASALWYPPLLLVAIARMVEKSARARIRYRESHWTPLTIAIAAIVGVGIVAGGIAIDRGAYRAAASSPPLTDTSPTNIPPDGVNIVPSKVPPGVRQVLEFTDRNGQTCEWVPGGRGPRIAPYSIIEGKRVFLSIGHYTHFCTKD